MSYLRAKLSRYLLYVYIFAPLLIFDCSSSQKTCQIRATAQNYWSKLCILNMLFYFSASSSNGQTFPCILFILSYFSFRLVSSSVELGFKCSYHDKCYLRWERSWNVLQVGGTCSRPAVEKSSMSDLWPTQSDSKSYVWNFCFILLTSFGGYFWGKRGDDSKSFIWTKIDTEDRRLWNGNFLGGDDGKGNLCYKVASGPEKI